MIIVLRTVVPFLHLVLFSNYKCYLLSTFPTSLVLRRKGYSLGSHEATRKSVDLPALGEYDHALGALFVLTKYKYKNQTETEVNYSQVFHQIFKE